MTPAVGRGAELVHRDRDFGNGVTGVTALVAGEGAVEFSLDGGAVLAVLTPDPTGVDDPYAYTTTGAGIVVEGVHDVHLALRGSLRLARVGFSG